MGRKAIRNIDPKILKETMKEARKNGLAGVSTKRIADNLRISEALVFAHFQNKETLLKKALDEACANLPYLEIFPAHGGSKANYLKLVRETRRNPLPVFYISIFLEGPYASEANKALDGSKWLERCLDYVDMVEGKEKERAALFVFEEILHSLRKIVSAPKAKEEELASIYYEILFGKK